MSDTSTNKKKTGIFYSKNPAGVVVLQNGHEIARYATVEEFVSSHQEGLRAIKKLEEYLEGKVASAYTPYPPDPGKY